MYATAKNHEIIHADTRYCTHPGCSFITLKEQCNNQRPRCDIAWLHVTNHLYHGFRVKMLKNLKHTIMKGTMNSNLDLYCQHMKYLMR